MPTEQWLTAANAALAAIRATGATNLVTVPGNAWTGAHSWSQNWYGTPNATVMKGIVDPGQQHDLRGAPVPRRRLVGHLCELRQHDDRRRATAGLHDWLRSNGHRALLGEVAGGDNATCNAALTQMLGHLESNADVWSGWTWWAAGPWWSSYMYSIEPSGTADKPQMSTLAPFLD